MRCINSKTNYNDGCAYSCKRGYTAISGNQARKCQADGTWSGQELVCEGNLLKVTIKLLSRPARYTLMYRTVFFCDSTS